MGRHSGEGICAARARGLGFASDRWIGFVGAADAATLSVSPDKTTYLVGERITLTVDR